MPGAMKSTVDEYRVTRQDESHRLVVVSGFVYDAPAIINWVQGLHLGSALVRLRRMGWKVEKVISTNVEPDTGRPTI